MARPTKTPLPELGAPAEQALVTPAVRPEVLLALQQTQANQAINNECALIRQAIGTLQGEMQGMKDAQTASNEAIKKIDRFHSIVIGVLIAASVLFGGLWYFVGSKVSTLLELADRQQVIERIESEEADGKVTEAQVRE